VGTFTRYGYERSTLQQILSRMKQKLRSRLGEDWNIETGSVEDQFISIFAEEADQVEQGIEGVIASSTIDGAEGVYLDDILSARGIYRKGKTPSSGVVHIGSDYSQVLVGRVIPSGTSVSASNGLTYFTQEDITIDNYTSCYELRANQIAVGTNYTFTLYNVGSPTQRTFSFTATSESDKDVKLEQLASFVNEVILDAPTKAFYSSSQRTMFVGFNSDGITPNAFPRGFLYVNTSPRVGIIYQTSVVISDQLGFNPLDVNGVETLSPTYTGFSRVVNSDPFNSGSDIQTDAEYRLASINFKESAIAGTKESLEFGIAAIDGVADVKIYNNPTKDAIFYQSTKVAEPYSYNIVVLGGDDQEVANVIRLKSPSNTNRFGYYTVPVLDFRNAVEDIMFTRASYSDIEIDVVYTTKDGNTLTNAEKTNINTNLLNLVSSLRIGDTVPYQLVEATVYQSVDIGRLLNVRVFMRVLGTPTTKDNADINVGYDKKARVSLDNVQFIRG
jgi:hypothetical protein